MQWEILKSGKGSAAAHMERDRELLTSLEDNPRPIIHLYDFEGDAATYGHFIDPNAHLRPNHTLDLARRPTGGGIVFHSFDLAFSVLVPAGHEGYSINTLDNYRYVNERIIKALKGEEFVLLEEEVGPRYNFCMAKPTIYDIVVKNQKVGGAAQRRTRHGWLHQGTLALSIPSEEYLNRVLLPGRNIVEAMRTSTHSLLGEDVGEEELKSARLRLQEAIVEELIC